MSFTLSDLLIGAAPAGAPKASAIASITVSPMRVVLISSPIACSWGEGSLWGADFLRLRGLCEHPDMRIPGVIAAGWPVWFEMSETVAGPPDVVWSVITDWERLGDWMLEASDFRVLSEQREGLGVEAEATIKIGGLKTRDRVRVVGWEPPRRLAIEHLGWVKGMGEFH